MAIPADVFSSRTIARRAFRLAAAAGCLIGWTVLAACSNTPSGGSPSVDASSLPSGGMAEGAAELLPTVEAQGVYPVPGSVSAGGTPVSKEALRSVGTNSVYLPAIINEKPPLYPFEVQQTGVLAIQGFFGCEWTGVAGQIFDPTGDPIQNLIVHLEGFWNGGAMAADVLSGSAAQYGPAGYEFILGNQPLNSSQALWVQLQDATHKIISARIYFNTYNDCARNLILINFVEVIR